MRYITLLIFVLALAFPTYAQRKVPLKNFRRTTISIKGNKLRVWVAEGNEKLEDGFMFIKPNQFKPDEGMIFIMPNEEYQVFWMKNTPSPLDIAYLRPNGTIINILTMKPFDESQYPSDAPAKYAVETHAGYFAKKHIRAGDKFDLKNLKLKK